MTWFGVPIGTAHAARSAGSPCPAARNQRPLRSRPARSSREQGRRLIAKQISRNFSTGSSIFPLKQCDRAHPSRRQCPSSWRKSTGAAGVIVGGRRAVWSRWSLPTPTPHRTATPMTETSMDLSELLAKHDQGDFLRSIAEAVPRLIMEADVEGLIGARRHERNGERTAWRNGYRERALDTRLGTLNLRVPKLRQGSTSPLPRSPQDLGIGAGGRHPEDVDRRRPHSPRQRCPYRPQGGCQFGACLSHAAYPCTPPLTRLTSYDLASWSAFGMAVSRRILGSNARRNTSNACLRFCKAGRQPKPLHHPLKAS